MTEEKTPPNVPPGTDLAASERVSKGLEQALSNVVDATRDHYEGLIVAIILTRLFAEAAERDLGAEDARAWGLRARDIAMRADIQPLLDNLVCVDAHEPRGEA